MNVVFEIMIFVVCIGLLAGLVVTIESALKRLKAKKDNK